MSELSELIVQSNNISYITEYYDKFSKIQVKEQHNFVKMTKYCWKREDGKLFNKQDMHGLLQKTSRRKSKITFISTDFLHTIHSTPTQK